MKPACLWSEEPMNMSNTGLSETEGGEPEFEVLLDPKVQESIGRSLKAHYDDLINAPVPDRFLMLLAQLEASESSLSAKDASDERI